MMSTDAALAALRKEIDAIDRDLHDLIMRRTRVVEKVRAVKEGERIKIRPGREAEIVYRLLGRHKGPFPRRELVRIWRELIVATLSMEGPFSVAVQVPEDDENAYWDMARDQYGSFTALSRHATATRVVEAVRALKATVGILAQPQRGDDEPWWPQMINNTRTAPRVIAKLPFVGGGNARGASQAFVIARVEQEKTGRDRSFLVVEAREEISRQRLVNMLKAARMEPVQVMPWHDDQKPEQWLHLAEIDGFVAPGDRRLDRFLDEAGDAVRQVCHVGGYALPLGDDDLAGEG